MFLQVIRTSQSRKSCFNLCWGAEMNIDKIIGKIQNELDVDNHTAQGIYDKAVSGNEITDDFTADEWLEQRFLQNCVLIDEEGYSKMCIDALKILGTTAATDYGSSRQRDLGQLWADMTRGYLGELAFLKFLEEKWNIKSDLGHEVGALQDYLPMDIHKVKKEQEEWRIPSLKIGVKTTKWNGIWLDIPGDQFNHSDMHVLIKVGAGRDHLFAFFKGLSVFKDKVLKRGEEVGSLTSQESQDLYDKLPSFKPIPAYICGFVLKSGSYNSLAYSGKRGRTNFTIKTWNGPIYPGDLEKIKQQEQLSKVKFEGIGDFSHDKGYLFNTGNLLWGKEDWHNICQSL